MKRALVVLLALVMGAGLLFAADQAPAKWTFYGEANLVLWDQDGNAMVGYGTDDFYSEFGVTYSEDVFGFGMLSTSGSDDFILSIRNISGWYKLFDGMLKITAGKDRIGDYRATTYIEGGGAYTRIANAEWGLALQAYPIKGLSAGAFVNFPEAVTAADYANNLGFGASYTMDLLTFNVLFRTINSGAVSPYTDNELGVSAVINAIEGLPIMLGYGLSLYDVGDPKHNILFSTKYSVNDALSLALDVNVAFVTDMDYAAELLVEYKLNPTWHVGANLEYGTNGYGPLADTGFFAYPWVQCNVGTAHTLKLGFKFETDPSIWSIPFFYSWSF
jgi:hypothetical protein